MLAVTPLLAGDPRPLTTAPATVADALDAAGLPPDAAAGRLSLGDRAAAVSSLGPDHASLALHVLVRPEAGREAGAPELVFVLAGSLRDAARAIRLIGRLRAGCADGALVAKAATATTREDLVRVLAPLDLTDLENPLVAGEILPLLGASRAGLTVAEVDRRRAQVGPNVLERVRRRSRLARFAEQFVSLFAVLLWIGGGLALLSGMPELGWAIFAVVVINGVFSFLQEYRAERAVQALQRLLPHEITVLRDGAERRAPAVTLVPGDIVRLEEGDQVPGDLHLLAAEGLRVDQSALTGESHPVFKRPADGNGRAAVPRFERYELAFAGSSVVAGTATAVVLATGMDTEIGDVAHLTQAVAEPPSPLEREMVRVTRVVTALALAIGGAFLVLGISTGRLGPAEGFVFALGVIVANVPEGLLPTMTLALALAVQRMARRHAIVRRLSAVETLGATTVICTDKTGTLTEGRMATRAVWTAAGVHAADDLARAGEDVRDLVRTAVLASQANAEHGDPMERALVITASGLGLDPAKLRAAAALVAAYPFDSFRKRMTLVRAPDGTAMACVKGAPRETLALCATIRVGDDVVPLTDGLRDAFLREHDRLAGEGLRLLAIARRPLPSMLVGAPEHEVERALTLLGFVALWDPPRVEVPEAVALCRRAGIRVLVLTGDYGLTGQAIARRIGLRVAKVVNGHEVERLDAGSLRRLAREPGVLFARMSPVNKLSVVEALKAGGDVVAVTGDGVNDAPALRVADIGIAMGGRGTEVARESSEMVLADDNFATIVAAVREGRAIYANMGKFVRYIFASNVPELMPFLAFVLLGVPLPLTVMQILAVDLGTDLVPALGLGSEPAEPGVMDRPPRSRHERLLGAGRLVQAYAFLGVAEAVLSLAGFFWVYWLAGWRPGLPMASTGDLYERATTMTLAGIVAAQIGNVFACRTERESVFRVGLFRNRLVLAGIVVEVVLLVGLILVPPLRDLFGLAPLTPREWAPLLAFPAIVLGLEEGRKWLARRGRAGVPTRDG
jgi:calcium-translocating P-type ATPase